MSNPTNASPEQVARAAEHAALAFVLLILSALAIIVHIYIDYNC